MIESGDNNEDYTQNEDDNSLTNVKPERLSPKNQSNLEEKAEKIVMRVLESHSRSMFSGPLPPPQLLKAYDLVEPGLAREIVDMAKKQSQHRIEMERTVIVGDSKRSWAGLFLGFIISCILLGSSSYLILKGHDVAGATLVTSALVSVVSTFIYGSNQRTKERAQKQKALIDSMLGEAEDEEDD